MSEANVVFTLDEVDLTIKCTTEDKMEDICKNYSSKINKNLDSLLFLYEGNKVDFALRFKEQANIKDTNNHEMKILVSKNENSTKNNIKENSNSGNVNCLKSGNLLNNIKSEFFSEILFSFLDEKIKL